MTKLALIALLLTKKEACHVILARFHGHVQPH